MGEAIISRAGTPEDPNTPKLVWKLFTELITENRTWTVPANLRNGEVSVRIFGGGAGKGSPTFIHGYGGGGGGGYMNNEILKLASGTSIQINIGDGGEQSRSGGTTIFGPYLSAAGGTCSESGTGGDGGSGGGAHKNEAGDTWHPCVGGKAQYGGGGGGSGWAQDPYYGSTAYGGSGGQGGIYGGNGGYGANGYWSTISYKNSSVGKNGTNTIGLNLEFEGDGSGGSNGSMQLSGSIRSVGGCGGDGGYGGIGGSGGYAAGGGGGGGGYGGNGGSGSNYGAGGGGGGYGGKGADASDKSGGGGGGYGIANYGAGGGGSAINGSNGKSGVCIIQYYQLSFA